MKPRRRSAQVVLAGGSLLFALASVALLIRCQGAADTICFRDTARTREVDIYWVGGYLEVEALRGSNFPIHNSPGLHFYAHEFPDIPWWVLVHECI
jgi:hypothetical protein